MAFATDKQVEAVRQLEEEYGRADLRMLEITAEPYGLVRLVWFEAFGAAHGAEWVNIPRIVDTKPDGSRQMYTELRI